MASAVDLIRRSQGQGPAPLPDADQEWLDAAADMGKERLDRFDLYRRFYEGDHGVQLTDRAREFLHVNGVPFRENFCEPMVDMVGERLEVEGFDVQIGGGGEAAEANAEAATDLARWLERRFWRANNLDEGSDAIHTVALSRGESFGILGWDKVRQVPTFAYNPPERVKVVYADDDPNRKLYAVKVWNTTEAGPSNPDGMAVTRMNVYWPDRIEAYYRLHRSENRGGWARWIDPPGEDGQRAPWPRPWVDAADEPLGIPVVHFRNRPLGEECGRSELENAVPFQAELNKQVLDLILVLDNQGWAQRWVSGVDPSQANFVNAPGEIWIGGSKDARFGQFDNGDLAPILDTIEKLLSRMARRQGMPLHLLTQGDAPSGESIKASESRLVKRCRNRAVVFGNAWEEAARLAIRLARSAGVPVPGPEDLDELTLNCRWEDPASEDLRGDAETAIMLQQVGVSKRTLLAQLGFDPDQEEQNRRAEAEEAVSAAQRFLDTGDDGGGGDDDEPAGGGA
jgi:hypothetical protein